MYDLLLHSHLLQSLGNAIVHSLWQSLLLLVIYKGITYSIRDLKPAVKHNLSVIFVFITFAWFAFTFQKNYFISEAHFIPSHDFNSPGGEATAFSIINIPSEIASTLSLAYLVLLSFLMARLIFSIAKVLRIQSSNMEPADAEISTFAQHAASLLKIKRKVIVWIGKNVDIPATVGFLKPVILLPAVCLTRLTPQQIEAIIIHELSHIRRNDYLLNLILVIIETILFFNPAVFIFMKTIRSERENCCDDLVLKSNYEPLHYAKALLTLSREHIYHQKIALNASSRGQQLLYRIKRITGGNLEKPAQFSGRMILFAVLAIVFFSFSVFTNKTKRTSEPAPPRIAEKNIAKIKITDSIEDKLPAPKIKSPKNIGGNHSANKEIQKILLKLPTVKIEDLISKEPKIILDEVAMVPNAGNKGYDFHFENIAPNNQVQLPNSLRMLSELKEFGKTFRDKDFSLEYSRLEKEIANAQKYNESTEKYFRNFKINTDSIVHYRNAPGGERVIILPGKKIIDKRRFNNAIVTPQTKAIINMKGVKRLRTANI